ncbi:nuclear transport factor 2 family protein [Vibrio sp. SM6]|uniref:Nuclear transport factor 2 family protein n=1 Tax=Vibrio agarilyticus TaxID=2726741 RepID=A0A7X8YH06_9VIBR|nr:nuclear transport factor 2 family protein [Vibrio agarilyticus]NLS13090.1 nuclear transport factor 2 family protein [Vibrio agarilyticus]
MSSEQNHQVVNEFFQRFSNGDVPGVLELLTPDVDWRMMGQQGGLPVSGNMDQEGIKGLMAGVKETVIDHLAMTPKGWTIDGDRVAVEVESFGNMKNGKTYNNLYHYLIEMKQGKIWRIREYGDTDQVRRVFLEP